METFLTSPKFEWSSQICSNFIKVVKIYPNDFNFIQIWTLIIQQEISERTKILMEFFYIAHLWTRLFEVVHNWM